MLGRLRGTGEADQASTGYPLCVFTHDSGRRIRRSLLTVSVACSLVLAAALVSPAAASQPEGWDRDPPVSALHFVTVILLIPLSLAAILILLTILPGLARDRGYEPGQTWRGEAEWFGGPTKGVKSAAEVTPEQIESRSKDTGGTSASW
jgi:hypothetical protein